MSDYLPIVPLGVGTVNVESLSSLFCRMAELHCLTLWQLASHLSNWWGNKHGTEFSLQKTTLYATSGCGISGFSAGVDAYVQVISTALGVKGLEKTTLVPLRPAVARKGAKSIRTQRAWCPACFTEDLRAGGSAYERLLWTLAPLRRCPEHRIMLESMCPSCGATQPYYHRQGILLSCWKCSETLVPPADRWVFSATPTFGEKDCCELIQAISTGELEHAYPEAFRVFAEELKWLSSPTRKLIREVARSSGSLIATGGQSRPSLVTMLARTHVSGVRLVSVLASPKDAAISAGELIFERAGVPYTAKPRRPRDAVPAAQIRLTDELARPRGTGITSLKSIAQELGVSIGFIRHHCAPIVKQLMRRRQSEATLKTWADILKAQNELAGGLLANYQAGGINSQAHLIEQLVERCGVSKYVARRALAIAIKRSPKCLNNLSL